MNAKHGAVKKIESHSMWVKESMTLEEKMKRWAPEDRARIIAEIGWLVDQVPAPESAPASALSSSPERSTR